MNSSSSVSRADYFKIVFLGSRKVGKTSIVRRIFDQESLEEYFPTIGVRIHNLEIITGKKTYLQLWDVSGNEIYFDLVPSVLKNASIVNLVFDYKNKDTQSVIEDLYDHVCKFIASDRILIIGNKAENEKNEIPKLLKSWLKIHDLKIISISALNNNGISLFIQTILRLLNETSEELPIKKEQN